jgi:Tfp pilus assembly protein PilV
MQKIIVLVLIGVLGVYGYGKYERSQKQSSQVHQQIISETSLPAAISVASDSQFKCDGRTYCSQMTSCAEATHFLKTCPGTKMDGNGDGIPCEVQWCK